MEMFRVGGPKGIIFITIPFGKRAEAADQRVNKAFFSNHERPHPMLKDHVANGLPEKTDILRCIESARADKGVSVLESENTPIWLWEQNLMWFAVERWLPGLRHLQRLLLQPLFPVLKRLKSGSNYRVAIVVVKE